MVSVKIKSNIDSLVNKELEKKKKETIERLVNKLKEATPVDTGNARDHWNCSNKVIENEVDYIDVLNKGSSSQAPAYFIEKTLLSQPGVMSNGTIVRSV
jgi:hypothetical protein